MIWRELGDRMTEAITLTNLAGGWFDLGATAEALKCTEEGLKLIRDAGDRAAECSPLIRLSTLALWAGDATKALEHARTALDVATTVQATDLETLAWCCIGNAELAQGRLDAAEHAYLQGAVSARRIGEATESDALAGRARVARERGDRAAALAFAEELLRQRGPGPAGWAANTQRLWPLPVGRRWPRPATHVRPRSSPNSTTTFTPKPGRLRRGAACGLPVRRARTLSHRGAWQQGEPDCRNR